MIPFRELQTYLQHPEVQPEIKDLVDRELAHCKSNGEYLLPNLWVNRNTGTRAYYEFSWHDGRNYHMLCTNFADRGEQISDDEFYSVYEMAKATALLDPNLPFNLTMCQLEPSKA